MTGLLLDSVVCAGFLAFFTFLDSELPSQPRKKVLKATLCGGGAVTSLPRLLVIITACSVAGIRPIARLSLVCFKVKVRRRDVKATVKVKVRGSVLWRPHNLFEFRRKENFNLVRLLLLFRV